MACAVVPMFVLLLPLEFTIYKWNDALFHTFFGLVLSAVLIEVMFAGFRKVPFTCSYFGGKGNLVGLAVIYVIGFTTYSHAMAALEVWLLRHPLAIPLWFGCCAASVIALRRFNRSELEEDRDLSYEDPGDPAVTTLGLDEG